jgi:hypothetical protein
MSTISSDRLREILAGLAMDAEIEVSARHLVQMASEPTP